VRGEQWSFSLFSLEGLVQLNTQEKEEKQRALRLPAREGCAGR